MYISLAAIKRILDQYDQSAPPVPDKTFFLIVKHINDEKTYINKYSEMPEVRGVYVLTKTALYFGQGPKIRLIPATQVSTPDKEILRLDAEIRDHISFIEEPNYHYCSEKDVVIKKLKQLYFDILVAKQGNELTIKNLYDLFDIILIDPWELPNYCKIVILKIFNEMMNDDGLKPGEVDNYLRYYKLKLLIESAYIEFIKIILSMEEKIAETFPIEFARTERQRAYNLLKRLDCNLNYYEFEFSLKNIEFLSSISRFNIRIKQVKEIAAHHDIETLIKFIQHTNHLGLSARNYFMLNRLIRHISLKELMVIYGNLQKEDNEIKKQILLSCYDLFVTCTNPKSLMEIMIFLYHKQDEINIIRKCDDIDGDIIISHQSIIYKLYDHGLLIHEIFLAIIKINNPLVAEEKLIILFNHLSNKQLHLLAHCFHALINHDFPIELCEFIQSIHQLNENIIHKSFLNQEHLKPCLELSNLLHLFDLLNNKYYDSIIHFYLNEYSVEALFEAILIDGIESVLDHSISHTHSYYALFDAI